MADGNGEWWAAGSLVAGIMAWLLQHASALGRLVRRVDDCEARLDAADDCMRREDCTASQDRCRQAMYRELTEMKDLIRRGEEQRDKARREDLAWRQEMRDVLITVRTQLKEHLKHE